MDSRERQGHYFSGRRDTKPLDDAVSGLSPDGDLQSGVTFTAHALIQSRRRGISAQEIRLVAVYGTGQRRTGIEFCVLCRADVRDAEVSLRPRLEKLVGTVVLIGDTHDGSSQAVTAYRDRQHALRVVRRKAKYRRATGGARDPFAPFAP